MTMTPAPKLAAFAALLLAAAAPAALAAGAAPSTAQHCSNTASLMHDACGDATSADLSVAKAKCTNLGNSAARAQCQADARAAATESQRLCQAQLDARRSACTLLGQARYDPPWDPQLFDSDFAHLSNPNPYFPLGIGNQWVYAGGAERDTVEVVAETKLVAGVTCIVLRDRVYTDGQLTEATDDWFAAARDGSTWYCGEQSGEYEFVAGDQPPLAELVSIDGSFKHGRDNDKAGVIMPARPQVGQTYREEFSLGNAEDLSTVLATDYSWGQGTLDRLVPRELAQRLCGNRDCLVTKNWSLLDPSTYELKYYARGIGLFLETQPDAGEVLQLVECNFDARCVGLPPPALRRR